MELIYILTYDCNFRCKYCDINKRKDNITSNIIKQSIIFLENNKFDITKVKFFGWEPLLKENYIRDIILHFPQKNLPTFYVTTNSTLIDDKFVDFALENNLKLTFSIDWDIKSNSENRLLVNWNNRSIDIINNTKKYSKNIRVNQVITSQNSENFFRNFKFIYDLWVRNFNFLPEYYNEWSKKGLNKLKQGFDQILDFYNKWNKINLVNLDNFSETSFFNLGLVIDTNWKIYWTNLILSWIFEKYKKELIIWTVYKWLFFDINNSEFKVDYINKIDNILKKEYSNNILKSVYYVDLILNNFCNKINNEK